MTEIKNEIAKQHMKLILRWLHLLIVYELFEQHQFTHLFREVCVRVHTIQTDAPCVYVCLKMGSKNQRSKNNTTQYCYPLRMIGHVIKKIAAALNKIAFNCSLAVHKPNNLFVPSLVQKNARIFKKNQSLQLLQELSQC